MVTNPFTNESRDEVVSLHLDCCQKLRMPTTLRRMLKLTKPDHVSIPDFLLKAALDGYLMSLIWDGNYRLCQATLETLFGCNEYDVTAMGTSVANGNGSAK